MASRWRVGGATAVGLLAVALWLPQPSSAAGSVTPEPAQMVSGIDSTEAIEEGGSATEFSLRLSDGASCPGDSADDDYRVNSYMVPFSVDPAGVTYNGLGPTPNEYGTFATFRQPLYDVDSNSFVSAQTADAVQPGDPGLIIGIPSFDFAVYKPGDLPAGRYHVGIACTLNNEVVKVWDTELVVTSAAGDEPAAIHWTNPAASGSDGSGPSRSLVAVVLAIVVTAGIGALAVRRRASSPAHPLSQEE